MFLMCLPACLSLYHASWYVFYFVIGGLSREKETVDDEEKLKTRTNFPPSIFVGGFQAPKEEKKSFLFTVFTELRS